MASPGRRSSITIDYRSHSSLSDPGKDSAALRALPDSPRQLLPVIQGLLLHSDQLRLYGLCGAAVPSISRETLPVEARLAAIFTGDPAPLVTARPPGERSLATCRDFALLLTACLREKGWAARVRCGFAAYFTPSRFEDHWVCQYWDEADGGWRLADAQLDQLHRRHLGIAFDPAELPHGAFLTGPQAWAAYRCGRIPGARFGHGQAVGPQMLLVNLVRDGLALLKQETSDWDSWRESLPWSADLEPGLQQSGDDVAAAIARLETRSRELERGPAADAWTRSPFWRRGR